MGCESEVNIAASDIQANAGILVGAISEGGLIYNCVSYGEITVASGVTGAIAGEISGTVTLVCSKNKTEMKDCNLAEGAHVHTASVFTKAAGGIHTAVCECDEAIELACVVSEHGYCKYCEIDITGASISLGDEIAINYYVSVKDASITEGKTLAMEFLMNGKSITVDKYSVKNGKLVFKLGGILPKEIGDLIDAKLIVSDGEDDVVLASKLGYSVKDNCLALLDQLEDEKGREVIVSLLEYASKAQAYLDYNTDKFVLGGLTVPASDKVPTEENKEILLGNKNSDCCVTDSYTSVEGSLKLKIELSIADLSALTITVNGKAYDSSKLISLGDSKYVLEIGGFLPYDIDESFDIRLFYQNKQAAKLKLGINSHLYSLVEDKQQIEEDKANHVPVTKTVDEAEYALFLAIYRYNVAAEEYYNLLTEVSK